MAWQDIQKQLMKKKSKDFCLDFALSCFDLCASSTSDQYILDTVALVKDSRNNTEEIKKRLRQVCSIRVTTDDQKAMEAAHIALHIVETAISVNYISAAGHAARCADALSRIDTKMLNDISGRFLS